MFMFQKNLWSITKPDILSLIPRTHTVEGKNQVLHAILWLPY